MKITLDVPVEDLLVFFDELNRDEGLREKAVDKLMANSSPDAVAKRTVVIRVLSSLSKAAYETLFAEGRLASAARVRELMLLVQSNKEATR